MGDAFGWPDSSPPSARFIDEALVSDHFAALGAHIALLVAEAAQADLTSWVDRLTSAAANDDAHGLRQARDALADLCAPFHAAPLTQAAHVPLDTDEARMALHGCCMATIAAILTQAEAIAPDD